MLITEAFVSFGPLVDQRCVVFGMKKYEKRNLWLLSRSGALNNVIATMSGSNVQPANSTASTVVPPPGCHPPFHFKPSATTR